MSRLLLVVGLSLGTGVLGAADGGPAQAPPPRRIPIEALVKQLASADVTQREEAEKRLIAIALDPPPELLAAATSDDPNQRERASKVAQAMRWNVVATRLPRGQRFAEQGRVDLFVAATAVWSLKPDDDRLWEPAQDLGRRLIEKAEMKGDRKPHNCPSSFRDYATYKRLVPPRFKRLDELYTRTDPQQANPPVLWYQEAVQARGLVCPTGIINNLIVSRGSVWTEKTIQASVVFANGDVTSRGVMLSSVVVCDGNVTVTDSDIAQALVVARGNITVKGRAACATLIAGGKVTLGDPRKPKSEHHFNVIVENEPNSLGFITFFELSRVGLEVKVADGAVQVAKVEAKSESEKAGVKVGDAILDVNGKKPADGESLRRLLRDALAVGDATVNLQRGKDTINVKLSLPD